MIESNFQFAVCGNMFQSYEWLVDRGFHIIYQDFSAGHISFFPLTQPRMYFRVCRCEGRTNNAQGTYFFTRKYEVRWCIGGSIYYIVSIILFAFETSVRCGGAWDFRAFVCILLRERTVCAVSRSNSRLCM